MDLFPNMVDTAHAEAADMLRDKVPDDEIIKKLQEHGIEEFYAGTILENVKSDRNKRKNFWLTVLSGCVFVVLGLILNFASWYFSVRANSPFAYVFWGIIVFGIVTIFRGFVLFKKRRRSA